MTNRKGFMIPMVFILVVALSAIVGSLTLITTTSVRSMGQREVEEKALCIAEAGLNKAIWYLTTPPEEGGMGMDWRTEGVTEEFGGGSYSMIVEEDSEGIKISSVSSFKGGDRSIQVLANEDFADDFIDYALFSAADFEMEKLCQVSGDLLVDGNVVIPAGARVINGFVAVTEGHTITGGGEYTEGDPAIIPETPSIDSTYYNNQIAVAEAGGPNVVQGFQFYTDLDLNGLSLYVDGTVTLAGNITGAGEIIATGNIIINRKATIGEKIKLISKSNLSIMAAINTSPVIKKDVVLFAGNNISTFANFKNQDAITFLGSENVFIGNLNQISGIIYGGNVYIGNKTDIQGITICESPGATNTLDDTTNIIYKKHNQSVPPGFKRKINFGKWSMK